MTSPSENGPDRRKLREELRKAMPAPAGRPTERRGDEPLAMCDFCRLPISSTPIQSDHDPPYQFCCRACLQKFDETDAVFTEYHGFRRIRPGVDGLDSDLPEGIPRNSFVLLSGQAGTRGDALGVELIWRTLERNEPAVLVTFTEPPISLIQRFLDLEWNVLPALEDNRLQVVDCFTSRIDDRDRFRRRLNRWNRHLTEITEPQTTVVNDPSDPAEIRNKLDNAIEDLEMADRGAVHVDSLTEFGTLVQPVRAYDFIKDLRADVCKARFVPIFGGATVTNEEVEFPHDLSYVLDGIIDLELTGSIVEDTLIRRLRVRKMDGVLAITEWKSYEFTAGNGLVTFDPIEEIAKSQAEAGEESDPEDG